MTEEEQSKKSEEKMDDHLEDVEKKEVKVDGNRKGDGEEKTE